MNANFLETARLLAQVAPLVFAENIFALKGGTAINLFVRDMPRLSVDLDLVFLDHRAERADALEKISAALRNAMQRLKAQGFSALLKSTAGVGDMKLFVRRGASEVQVEVNFIMRGTVKPASSMSILPRAREALRADLTLPVLSVDELYAGKLVAAMDRQHPRDLFDVHQLYLNGGITPEIRRCFVVYLACHNRPIHEVLFPGLRDLTYDFERGFAGMTAEPARMGKARNRTSGSVAWRSVEDEEYRRAGRKERCKARGTGRKARAALMAVTKVPSQRARRPP